MMRALYTAATGMLAQQTNVDNISNNLSNVNTVGFKQEKAEFKSLLYQTIQTKTTSANGESETDFLQCAAQTARHAIPEREILCGQWEPTALH